MDSFFTGERFEPDLEGEMRLEHYHRYAMAIDFVAGKSVLDLACGEGYGSFMLSKVASSVHGVDISAEAIDRAQSKYLSPSNNLHFFRGDASRLNFSDNQFDIVVSFETIEHLYTQEEMISEVRRVLKPEGILIISSPNKSVYSNEREFKNHFHVKELDFYEFNCLLQKQFEVITYFGQSLQISSSIFPVSENKSTLKAWVDDGINIKPQSPLLNEPVYYVAVCASKKDLFPELFPSVLFPSNFNLLKQYRGYANWAKSADSALNRAHKVILEKDKELEELGWWGHRLTDELDQALRLVLIKEQELEKIVKSNSWMITKPLRSARRIFFNSSYLKLCLRFFFLYLKGLYKKFPFSTSVKDSHKALLLKFIPGVLSFSDIPSALILPPKKLSIVTPRSLDVNFCLFTSSKPVVSVVIPVYGRLDLTIACLRSISKYQPTIPYEVIIIDDFSADGSFEVLSKIRGLRIYLNNENQGFIKSCNYGANFADGQYIHFLNNDTEVLEGWLDSLYQTFHDLDEVGLVGSKLIYPDGSLQEAGGIVWRDGSAWNFGRNQNADLPMFNYLREVDYCSGASIMIPRTIFNSVGGFDELYSPAYYEDTDLAFKIRKLGFRVIYQPLSEVFHLEGASCGKEISTGVKSFQVINAKKFYTRWSETLQNHALCEKGIDLDSALQIKKRILIVDICTPTPDQDSGSIDIYNIMMILNGFGYQVTFIPSGNFQYMYKYTKLLQRVGIEVLYAPFVTSVESHLEQYGYRYDLTILLRPQVADKYIEKIKKYCDRSKIWFHTVDLHFLRMEREAALTKELGLQNEAKKIKSIELNLILKADISTVLSEEEFILLTPLVPKEKIKLMPFARSIQLEISAYENRKNILFIGGFSHSPNVDAICFFVEKIMPKVRALLPEVNLLIVGSNVNEVITKLETSDIKVLGYVEDLASLFNQVKISIAPLRYGAGIKGKIASSLSNGVPVVSTSIASEGMGLANKENILVEDDADAFAFAIQELYTNKELWQKISENGLVYANNHWGKNTAITNIREIMKRLNLPFDSKNQKTSISLYDQ